MNYQFELQHEARGYQYGRIVGPMGEFYANVLDATPAFVEFMLNALNSVPPTTKETT